MISVKHQIRDKVLCRVWEHNVDDYYLWLLDHSRNLVAYSLDSYVWFNVSAKVKRQIVPVRGLIENETVWAIQDQLREGDVI